MTDLTNFDIGQVYADYITLNSATAGSGLTNTLTNVADGLGNFSPMQISTTAVNFNTTGGNSFQINGISLTATATNLNSVTGLTPDFTFSISSLNLPSGTTAQRTGAPVAGTVRWNTTTSHWEGWDGGTWRTFNVT